VYLERHGIVAISDIDTRRLTRILREKGAQGGAIMAGERPDVDEALTLARSFPGMQGLDLAKEVTTAKAYGWSQGSWILDDGRWQETVPVRHVVAYDFGVKRNILRMLVDRGCRVTVVPAMTTAEEVFALDPDGIFLSNGPGDPEPCDYAIKAIRTFLQRKIPVFGICLGHQLLALANDIPTFKMHHGHRGLNHPVKNVISGKSEITTQNHGFGVDPKAVRANPNIEITHINLNDDSIEGIRIKDKNAFSVQYHPEATPGPHDSRYLFDEFINMINRN
jgi:carbamoyl-phosphate synthase small subunit